MTIPIKTATKHDFLCGEKIVAMAEYKDALYVATESMVYRSANGLSLYPIQFIKSWEEDKA